MNAAAKRRVVRRVVPPRWVDVHEAAPQVALTMLAYVEQMRVSCRPSTVISLETDLFTFATFVIRHDKNLCCVAEIGRAHVEAFKVWQAARPGVKGGPIASATLRRRLGMVRMFFIRIIEWGWNDAPSRVPLYFGDVPKRDESLPKFLDDGDYVKFMRALDQEPVLRRRLSVELLARTGMRVGELCALDAHALTTIAGHPWLRIPVGKLHNDRFVPLHPHLVELISEYQTTYGPHDHGFLISGEQGVLNRYAIARWVSTIARRAGIGHVHPHKLRHTLATQAINRGMSLDAIAALLGHRSLDMTMRYARISNRVVQDEYNAVSAKVDALYKTEEPEPVNMRRLRAEHQRMLGNGWCNRPKELDCSFESICESCTHFATGPTFRPVVLRQRNHAEKHGQPKRAELFNNLLKQIDSETT